MDKQAKIEIDSYIKQRETLATAVLIEYITQSLVADGIDMTEEVRDYIKESVENSIKYECESIKEILIENKVAKIRNDSDEDNWKHRSSKMTCSTCMWYMPKKNSKGESKLGRCRRHAHDGSGWPVQFPGDWCGDHKIDENKT